MLAKRIHSMSKQISFEDIPLSVILRRVEVFRLNFLKIRFYGKE